jgi:hypothetical protein
VTTVVVTTVVTQMLGAWFDVRRHDRQVAERDDELGEWLVLRERRRQQRLNELSQQYNAAGVQAGGARAQGLRATNTIALYDYREQLRQARNFRLNLEVEERWSHRVLRWARRRPLPKLDTPARAAPLLGEWLAPTDGNVLTWSLDDVVAEVVRRQG